MGARGWQYWRYVGGPVLFPSFLGGVLLLFGGSLSAYATAESLTSGSIPLSPIQIGSFLNGNVIATSGLHVKAGTPFPLSAEQRSGMTGDNATSLMVDNGRIYQLVTVPVRSPLPVAWIAMGFELDDKAAHELADITGLAVTLSVNSGGQWMDAVSTMPAGTARQSDVVARRIEMSKWGNAEVVAVLSRSLADARAPFERLTKVLFLIAAVVLGLWHIVWVLIKNTPLQEALNVCGLASLTMLRVFILIALASLVWVPIGVWVGMRPRAAQIVQPIAQFMAAFPANLLFPIAVYGIVAWKLNPDIFLSPLMILGTQWYILFNVIAGASAIPAEMRYAAANFRVSGWLWWRKVALPAVLPFYVTGAITASGGSWNAAIVAELASWGDTQVRARGLGSYIADATIAGDFHRIVLGIGTMSLFVVIINRLFWRPLYYYAERKYRLT